MKKTIAILTALLLACGIFALAGCSGEPELDKKNLSGFAISAIPADEIIVGILHITSTKETSGYTFAHHKGFMEMAGALGLREDQIMIKDNIDDQDVSATKNALQELVDAECDIIFATSYNYMQTMSEFAAEHPSVIFSHCSGYMDNENNFNNYFGRIYEARYLSGIAAGMKMLEAKQPVAGYVAAQDVKNSEVTGGINAFALGVQSVYPEATVKVSVTGSWYNPEAEAAAAKALIDAGAYVIAQHCDTDGPQTTAQQQGVFGVGYNSDMTATAPDAHLCAPIWNWGVYYTAAVKDAIEGNWVPENYYGGTAEGLVGLSDLNEATAAKDTAEAIAEARQKIIDGSLLVFDTGLTKADGTVIDHPLTDAEITGGIDYYIKGVSLL